MHMKHRDLSKDCPASPIVRGSAATKQKTPWLPWFGQTKVISYCFWLSLTQVRFILSLFFAKDHNILSHIEQFIFCKQGHITYSGQYLSVWFFSIKSIGCYYLRQKCAQT